MVSYRRDGTPVPTPVWFGVDDAGRLYFRSFTSAAKLKRLERDPRVLIAPCTMRGKPGGPAAEVTTRILPPEEEERAEAAIQANYGLGRRFYETPMEPLGLDAHYVEITPAGTGAG